MFDRLKKILSEIAPEADIEAITEETKLVDDLGLDSMSMILMSLEIEEEFNFRFEESVRFSTVGEVCRYLEKTGRK